VPQGSATRLTSKRARPALRRDGAGLEIVSVGAGSHFLPEDQPEATSRVLAAWLVGTEKAG